jgi:hypothetical protein
MRNSLFGFLIIWIFASVTGLAQQKIRKGDTIQCDFKAPSVELSNRNVTNRIVTVGKSVGTTGRTKSLNAEFEVKYIGFPEDAQAAVQKAIDIWAATLKSPIKIRIFINWTVLQNSPNTLAFVVPTEIQNFVGSPNPGIWYPMTLAEKLAGKELNSVSEADIVATFNAGRPDWYLGTDRQTPTDKFDLVSVALHEIGHGLGFSGTFRVNNGLGSYGTTNGGSKIYDQYVFNGFDQSLLNGSLFPNGSSNLGNQLTGNSLIFKSEIAKALNLGGSFPRIYAPSPYAPGSSISHLDEGTYTNTKNSLMTPFASRGKAEHDPGPLVRGIFYEMGWLYSYLTHEKIMDSEDLTGKKFSINVNSDTTINSNSGELHYSYDGFLTEDIIPLTTADGLIFEAAIAAPQLEKTISYFFTVKDVLTRTYRYPINSHLSFFYGVDTKPPIIIHQPVTQILQFDKEILIEAEITDNIGIKNAKLEYSVNNGATKSLDLITLNGITYSATMDLSNEVISGGDQITYKIIAVDSSSQSNTAFSPASGVATINVKLFETKQVYLSDLNTNKNDFLGDFTISTLTGFTNGAIHSPHPYPNSQQVGESIDLVYSLLYPIDLDAINNFMEFDEVVLIAPDNDYVIVEGSADQGQSWIALSPEYDSRKNADWLTYYNSNIQNGDSKAIGTLNFYRTNKINLLETFSENEEILIRFRLHSNNSQNGWGWAIDNLKIQDIVLGTDDVVMDDNPGIVYPTPSNGNILYVTKEFSFGTIKIYNSQGTPVMMQNCSGNCTIDVSHLSDGIYFVKGENETHRRTQKVIILK